MEFCCLYLGEKNKLNKEVGPGGICTIGLDTSDSETHILLGGDHGSREMNDIYLGRRLRPKA